MLTKDELYRRIAGCVKSAMDAHGAEGQAGSIAKRIVGEVFRVIVEERAAERRRAVRIARRRRALRPESGNPPSRCAGC